MRKQETGATGLLVLVAVLVAACAGTMAGSWITARTGRTIPILVAAPVAAGASQVSFEDGFAPVVKRALPAIVNVSTSKIVRTPAQNNPFLSDPFFRQFFGNATPKNFRNPPSAEREQSLGSGVVVNPAGYILTNNHVLNGASDVMVLLPDKRQMAARVVGTDAKTDLAVLKVDANNLPVIAFGDSSKMEPGNFVLAIGSPFGLNQTVTMGIVSATGRGGLGIEDYEDFIQTDAAINPGNSGGALINEHGDLIGINTAILSGGSGGNEGVGFAIPGNMARSVMEEILKNGKVTRGWLGVTTQPVTQEIASAFHLPDNYGALISDVSKDSPAAASGLKTGDIVRDVNGQRIEDSRALQLSIGAMSPGTVAKLSIFRDGATKDIDVKLGEMPAAAPATAPSGRPDTSARLRGLGVATLTPDIAQQLQLPTDTKGVAVTSVDPASAAAAAGIQQGDVIQEVNHQPVTAAGAFERAVQSAGDQPVLLRVDRNGTSTFVVVQPR
jgi:serine protease Do